MNFRFSIFLISLLVLVNCTSNSQKAPTQQADTEHTSKNSLDWSGQYRGVLPCASCPGIDIEIKLYENSTYSISQRYQENEESIFRESGSFTWSDNGLNITLEHPSDSTQNQLYKVEENRLVHLDQNGDEIEGALAEHYILEKIPFTDAITEKYWKLVELYGQKVTMDKNQQKEVHIILKSSSGALTGYSGCNSLMGGYNTEAGNRIKFSNIAVTLRACDNLDSEKTFLNALEQADNYTIRNDTLSLNKAKMAPLAIFEAVYLY